MVRLPFLVLLFALVVSVAASGAQAKRARKAPAKAAPAARTTTIKPDVVCPSFLGVGQATKREFCDVLIGRDPQGGVIVRIPSHRGTANLSFDLHNRVTYSEELVKAGRGYQRATATIGVLTLDGTLLTRAGIQSEFRNARDLVDRVLVGPGSTAVKAVAPTGTQTISVEIPQDADAVSILGERLVTVSVDTTETFVDAGRPIAEVSNISLTYRPAPAKKAPAKKGTAKKKR